jgi:hypothetical protein
VADLGSTRAGNPPPGSVRRRRLAVLVVIGALAVAVFVFAIARKDHGGSKPMAMSGATPSPEGRVSPDGLKLILSPAVSSSGKTIDVKVVGIPAGDDRLANHVAELQVGESSGWKVIYYFLIQPRSTADAIRADPAGPIPGGRGSGLMPGLWTFVVPPIPDGEYRVRWDLIRPSSPPSPPEASSATLYAALKVRS